MEGCQMVDALCSCPVQVAERLAVQPCRVLLPLGGKHTPEEIDG